MSDRSQQFSFFWGGLQANTWRNGLDTDDDDADWLLGGAMVEHAIGDAKFLQKPDQSQYRHRVKTF